MSRERLKGLLSLLATTALWASSFPFIKIVVSSIGGYRYVWLRGLIALAVLSPYIALRLKHHSLPRSVVRAGLSVGVAYTAGLWLQGWGTGLTTASKSAFITGLNVVFVHIYVALFLHRYTGRLAVSLSLSLAGLYLLTEPETGVNLGDILVLLGAIAWAAQVILVDKASRYDPLLVVFFQLLPSLVFTGFEAFEQSPLTMPVESLLAIVYLGTACTIAAFALQVYGQKFVEPEIASLVFLLEPVLATIFSHIVLGETMSPREALGASMIASALLVSSTSIAGFEASSSKEPGRQGK